MTALRHTILTKLQVFYPFKNDTRLDFLGNVHCMMNLMVGIFLMGKGCGNVMRNERGLIEKQDGG
jgi:hypothetical protein